MNLKIILILIAFIVSTSHAQYIEVIWSNQVHTAQVNKILFNKAENLLISGSSDKTIQVLEYFTGEKIEEFIFENNVFDIALMADENLLLVSTKHRTNSLVRIFDMETKTDKMVFDLKKILETNPLVKNQEFMEVHAIPINENQILTGIGYYYDLGADHFYKGRLDLWDAKSGEWIREVFTGGMVNNMIISYDRKRIAISTIQRTSTFMNDWVYKEREETKLLITDASLNEFIVLLDDVDENMTYADTEVINDIAFSTNSNYITLATDDHHLYVYDIEKRELQDSIFSCDCYSDQAIGFVYDNKHIISGTSSGKVNIWNLEFAIKIDVYNNVGSQMISSLAASKTKNLYVVGGVSGKMSLITSKQLDEVDVQDQTENNLYIIKYTNESLEIQFLEDYYNKEFEVYDILGNKLDLPTLNAGKQIFVNIEHLVPSIYFISVTVNGQTITEKFRKIY